MNSTTRLTLDWKTLLLLMLGLISQTAKGGGMQGGLPTKTNLQVMQDLVRTMMEETVEKSHITADNRIVVKFPSSDDGWIVRNSMLSALQSSGTKVFMSSDSTAVPDFVIDVGGNELKVRYEDMFKDGMFGSKKVRRTISVGLSFECTTTKTKEVLQSGFVRRAHVDTVVVDDIPSFELASAKSTHAELPAENTFDRLVEPFVIMGATGVIVYLFFHVRS